MRYPPALILAIAADREDDLLTQLAGTLDVTDPACNELTVTVPEGRFRFYYRRVVSSTGVDAITIAGRPSSGTGEKWHVWIVQPERESYAIARGFRDQLAAWASSRQPTDQGKWHLLGPWAPDDFRALATAAAWQACRDSWWVLWRAEASAEGVAAQQALTGAELDGGE